MIRRGGEQPQHPAGQQSGYPGSQAPSYGSAPQQPYYQSSNVTPSAAWPVTLPGKNRKVRSGGLAAMVALVTGAPLGLAYAGWAFTARRGVFADFADGNTVSGDDAKSSDTMDTIFLIVAGVVALLALGLWIARMAARRTKGGALDIGGIALAGLGLVSVLVGLYLASTIADADGQAAQGDKGVLATLVVGGGFALLAVGLLIGVFTVRGRDTEDSRSRQHSAGAGYQTW